MSILFAGPTAEDGLSAYQIAVNNGFIGTEPQWLLSLVGAQGLSAYQLAQSQGYGGTLSQWLSSLVGPPGQPGPQGVSGILSMPYAEWLFGLGTPAATPLTAASGEWTKVGRVVHVSGTVTFNAAYGSFILPAVSKFGFGGDIGPWSGLGSGSPTRFKVNQGSNVVNYTGSSYNSPREIAFTYLTN